MALERQVNIWSFNPRTRKGATLSSLFHRCTSTVSIHAPVKVRHHLPELHPRIMEGFNPRTRKGATRVMAVPVGRKKVSIHAPVKVRPINPISTCVLFSFNPRTRKGATKRVIFSKQTKAVSIHAPVKVRRSDDTHADDVRLFQSTHP